MLKRLTEEALRLKAKCKEAGISSIVILVDDARHHSVSRSVYDRHVDVVRAQLEKVKHILMPQTIRSKPDGHEEDGLAWIDASLKPDGMLVLSINDRHIVSHQKIGEEHHLILAERPAETYGGAQAAMARMLEVLREEGGDVQELCLRENSVFKLPL